MLYTMDEVERPNDRIMNDDNKLDEWYKGYRNAVKQKLIKYHKDMGNKHVDRGISRTRRSIVHGGDKN